MELKDEPTQLERILGISFQQRPAAPILAAGYLVSSATRRSNYSRTGGETGAAEATFR